MEQLSELPKGVWGCAMCDMVCAGELAVEAFGEVARAKDSGLPLFTYMYRRFGPPWSGSDDHKEVASYKLTTSDPRIFLDVSIKGYALDFCFRFLITKELQDEYSAYMDHRISQVGHREGREPRAWREGSPIRQHVNEVLIEAMKELLRPVWVRDIPMNILGLVEEEDAEDSVEPSIYAGYGVPKEAMDARIKEFA